MKNPFYVDAEGVLRNSSDDSERPYDCLVMATYGLVEALACSEVLFTLEWTEKGEPIFFWVAEGKSCRLFLTLDCRAVLEWGGDGENGALYDGVLLNGEVGDDFDFSMDFSTYLLSSDLRETLEALGVSEC